ncbi:MAG: ATP synthase F0 subunit C [Candidatus Wallbacteria bacterium]|nr:ATP synthase F0 subunit C [Candidatus Wallbacteria bacterium]
MGYFVALAIAVGFGLPLAVLSAAQAQAKAAAVALEGIARQPEAAGKIQLAMIIALALIESLVIYALLMFFMLYTSLPSTADMLKAVQAEASAPAAPAAH